MLQNKNARALASSVARSGFTTIIKETSDFHKRALRASICPLATSFCADRYAIDGIGKFTLKAAIPYQLDKHMFGFNLNNVLEFAGSVTCIGMMYEGLACLQQVSKA